MVSYEGVVSLATYGVRLDVSILFAVNDVRSVEKKATNALRDKRLSLKCAILILVLRNTC